MKTNRNTLTTIAVIIAAVFTSLFLVVKVTALFITAYIFALLGVAALLYTGLFLLKNSHSYPWVAAIPAQVLIWGIIQTAVSVIFVSLEQVGIFTLRVNWFLVIQIIILAFFAVRVVLLNAGRVEIENVGDRVRENTADWRLLTVDLEALAQREPRVKPVLEAIRYSDPVTSPRIAEYDEKIREGVVELEKAVDSNGDVGDVVVKLQRQIRDRNNRAKLLKEV